MLNYNLPLTEAESEFASEHYPTIHQYLHMAGLPENDFYDIAVFGYLRAVRKYLARPELRQYKFSTIAFRAMSCDVYHSMEYRKRKKRAAHVEQYNEDIHTEDFRDPVAEAYESALSFQELNSKLTPLQQRIAGLRTEGYRDKEIAAICRLKLCEVELEMSQAQATIIPFPMDSAALAA